MTDKKKPRCPGQDQSNWKPEDIAYLPCPYCHVEIEFWKDEPIRKCSGCGREVPNPSLDSGCAEWCKHADECPGVTNKPKK